MKNEADYLYFKRFFEEGLANDIFLSQVHYFIYRLIGENSIALNEKPMCDERHQLNYLQKVSESMTIVSLSKIFDRKNRNKQFKVRCLDTLIEECGKLPGKYPIDLDDHPDLVKISTIASVNIPGTGIDNYHQLSNFYYAVLNSDTIKLAIHNLKTVRDKFIVHNEHNPDISELESFWEDCSFLRDIAKLYLSTVGQIFLRTSYAPLIEIGINKVDLNILTETGWLINLIEKVLGKDNVIYWWE